MGVDMFIGAADGSKVVDEAHETPAEYVRRFPKLTT